MAQRSILLPPTVSFPQQKQSKLKNFLFWFFIVEHLVILLLVASFAFLYVRTSAYAPFDEIQAKAVSFQPQPLNIAINETIKKYEESLPKNKNSWNNLESTYTVTDDEASSIMTGFFEGSKIVVIFKPENDVVLLMHLKDFNQPIMIDGTFSYDPESKLHVTTNATQIGSLAIPFSNSFLFNGVIEKFLNSMLYENGDKLQIQIKSIRTEDHKLFVTLFSEKKEDLERFLTVE